ncbi:MAG: hypothetical protein KF760_25465 [Candidatus Eremiobacteraeota bacterium]|nr:hypothetical protein [Candidatus Eremiobacteraeota bacterium]MCW5866826.1 hypothetical protein [Candidatus Eremiobacteraeota bacterium]
MNAKFLRSCGLAALLALSAVAEPLPAGQPSKAPVAPAVQAVKQPDRITSSDDVPVKKPATPAPSKIAESPAAKPVTASPVPGKVTEAPVAKPAAATPAPSKITQSPATKPVTASPAPGKVTEVPVAKPVTAAPASAAQPVTGAIPAQPPLLTENLVFPQAKTELKRLMIGNQAGIVKVLGPNREGVSYTRGIDDKNIARFSADACGSIFCALGISHDKLNKVAVEIMTNYSTLPRKEAVAFLAAVTASTHLTPEVDVKAERFLVQVMETDKDVHARRQAVLALAVKHEVESDTTDRVLALYEHSENLWETFPVQQYFEYHASQVKRLAHFPQLRERIAAVKSLYTPAILAALDGSQPVTVVP